MPASFASPLFLPRSESVELLATRNERAQTLAQMRGRGKPSGRRSSSATLFGDAPKSDSLDDLLPDGDQLRLKADMPEIMFNRAKQRRASASRDLRSLTEGSG